MENILESRIPSSGVHIHFIFGNVFINWNKIYNNNSIFSCASWLVMQLGTFPPTRLLSSITNDSPPHFHFCNDRGNTGQYDLIKSNQIKSNQIKSNQIKSNQIKSNQIKFKSNQIKSNSNHINRCRDCFRLFHAKWFFDSLCS